MTMKKSDGNPQIVIEHEGEYRGHRIVVIFGYLGYRCGYVEIDDRYDFAKVEKARGDIECHGGITYCRYGKNHPVEGRAWIGFDCSHYGDGIDLYAMAKYGFDESKYHHSWYQGPIPGENYVIANCERIVDQLIELPDLRKSAEKEGVFNG